MSKPLMTHLTEIKNSDIRPGLRIVSGLTRREKEVLVCAARGLSCEETGKELFLAAHTIKHYRRSILVKLLARNMTQAVAVGYEQGILQEKPLMVEVVIDGILFKRVA